MLFPFTIGIHAALAKTRKSVPNCLVQEGIAESIAKIFNIAKKTKPKPSVLSPERLGKAMYASPKAMEQAFRLYGLNSKTIKKAIPTAFGKV